MAGGSNYQGDLQEKYYDITLMHLCFGANITYNIDKHWSLRGEVWKGNVSASDAASGSEFASGRNLSFNTRLYEVGLAGIFRILIKENSPITPYLFGGLAVYRINPYTHDVAGTKYFLYPLSTEGQGLSQYPDKKEHQLYDLSIPLGGGITWSVSNQWSIGLEMGFRKTFTDYIDDVSNSYVDEVYLQQERGSKAVELAYRGDEIPGGNMQFPAAGNPRGNPKANDWYYNTIFRIQFKGFGEPSDKQKFRRQMDCPKIW
jgi:opacity protein-like surface antigen